MDVVIAQTLDQQRLGERGVEGNQALDRVVDGRGGALPDALAERPNRRRPPDLGQKAVGVSADVSRALHRDRLGQSIRQLWAAPVALAPTPTPASSIQTAALTT